MPKALAGQKVIDAETDLRLEITGKDIRYADAKDPLNCAAARAVKRQLKAVEVCVMRSRTYVNYGTKKDPLWTRYVTPEPLAREIIAIDRGGCFEAGNYVIKAPSASQLLGAYRNGHGKKSRRRCREIAAHRHVTANVREVE